MLKLLVKQLIFLLFYFLMFLYICMKEFCYNNLCVVVFCEVGNLQGTHSELGILPGIHVVYCRDFGKSYRIV